MTTAVFLLLASAIVGDHARLSILQWIIGVTVLGLLMRMWFIYRMDECPARKESQAFRVVVANILNNRPLVGFAIYLFCLYCVVNATVPVAFVFAKNALHLPDNMIVFASAGQFLGMIAGFVLSGRVVDRYGSKMIFLIAHFGFGMANLLFLMVHDSSHGWALIALVLLYGFLTASASVAGTSETMALAGTRNRILSLAFVSTLLTGGEGISRLIASGVLGMGILAPSWTLAGVNMTQFGVSP